MEILRDILPFKELKSIQSISYGTYEEYVKSGIVNSNDCCVIKLAAGSKSRTVKLLGSLKAKEKIPFSLSRTFTLDNFYFWLSKIKTGKTFVPMSNNRQKFIIQNFIPNLKGDYRVIVYGNKYYVVFRKNRENDFRASGSGVFNLDPEIPNGLLDYTKSTYEKFDTPYMTFDIAYSEGDFFIFEFQCICLGQLFFEKSKHYYRQDQKGEWCKYFEEPDLEREISYTVLKHIEKHEGGSTY